MERISHKGKSTNSAEQTSMMTKIIEALFFSVPFLQREELSFKILNINSMN